MAPQVEQRGQDTHPQPARFHHQLGRCSEGHQLAADLARECPGQLEWVPFPAPEQPLPAEWCGSHLNDPHAVRLPDHTG